MRPRLRAALVPFVMCLAACRPGTEDPVHEADRSWSVTAWGDRYEVFAETGPLVAGSPAASGVHVTLLEGFTPLRSGSVTVVLRGEGTGQAAIQKAPKRDGIFVVELKPEREGTFDLVFRIEGAGGPEEIGAGTVRVGTPDAPGGFVGMAPETAQDAVTFLKEQQWRTPFATAWTGPGTLKESVSGPARVVSPAGGEITLTAPVDATVMAEPWPWTGLEIARGATLFRLLPRASGRSLPDLQADASSLAAELEAARRRVQRLERLLELQATSVAELDRARTTVAGLEARLEAARTGVDDARQPASASPGSAVHLKTPWPGQVAEVLVTPGESVGAGAALARVVREKPVWVIVALRPEESARARGPVAGLLLRGAGAESPLEVAAGDLRVVSVSPEVDPRTASVQVILEVNRSVAEIPLNSAFEAELLLQGERAGIVVPASALVDDAGVTVAYVQLEGESFARREVQVMARQGSLALIGGIAPGERLVTVGGAAIRRSALLSSGAPEGHVH